VKQDDTISQAACKAHIKYLKKEGICPGDFAVKVFEDWIVQYEENLSTDSKETFQYAFQELQSKVSKCLPTSIPSYILIDQFPLIQKHFPSLNGDHFIGYILANYKDTYITLTMFEKQIRMISNNMMM
jgi:hypothetical protein